MAAPMLACLSTGIILRILLFETFLPEWLADKSEVATPLTSWKRVTEGLALHRQGISPYSGDIFHEMPIVLRVLNYLTGLWGPKLTYLFVLLDFIMAIVLERIAKQCGRYLLVKQSHHVEDYSPDSRKLILRAVDLHFTRLAVVAAYLFNPYSIACCLARSTAIFNNLAVGLAILFTLQGSRGRACLAIAVASYLSLYPIMLVVPTALFLAVADKEGRQKWEGLIQRNALLASFLQTFLCSIAALGVLLYISFMLQQSWDFLPATYGFILSVPDLTPNMGLFWYFFTEMFEHFRLFFICVFQINAFIYTVPLAIKLKEHPIFQMYLLVALMGIFKSYPSYADAALYLALLPLWKHVFQYMRNSFVVGVMFMVCTVMAPIMWHLWIYSGSANANFYFAITLVYSTAQVFLVTDLMFAFLRREYSLIHGTKPPKVDGKEAQIILD